VERTEKTGNEKDKLKVFEEKISRRLGSYVYGRGNTLISDNLKTAVETAGGPVTISAAESITGGLISSIITDTPGSSGFFKGSVVSYSESAKEKILGIDPGIIKSMGAVSREVCEIMADNVRSLFDTDYSLSVTGYAGPEYEGDNLGQVFCCIKGPSGYSKIFEKKFLGNRTEIKFRTTQFVLNELRNAIKNRRR
jgi:PncC family amidohydrolase